MGSVQLRRRVQTYQIDFSGHVNNSVYTQWCEEARVELVRRAGYPVTSAVEGGKVPALTETHILFKRPLVVGDEVLIEAWVEEIGGASGWIATEIRNDRGEIAATARQRGVWIDARTGRPARLTAEEISAYRAFGRETD